MATVWSLKSRNFARSYTNLILSYRNLICFYDRPNKYAAGGRIKDG